jgi:hypothetical protein
MGSLQEHFESLSEGGERSVISGPQDFLWSLLRGDVGKRDPDPEQMRIIAPMTQRVFKDGPELSMGTHQSTGLFVKVL